MKLKLYYVDTGRGCGLKAGMTERGVRSSALREVGTAVGVKLVRLATDADIAWVRGMGGVVPRIAGDARTLSRT